MHTLAARWSVGMSHSHASVILPDGCRDLICRERPGRAPDWFVSPLQTAPKRAQTLAGDRLTGFRLHAGADIAAGLPEHLAGLDPNGDTARTLLAENTRLDPNLHEALACLATRDSVAKAARDLGVGMRSLQRLIRRRTGQSPVFWRQLARVRQAGRLLGQSSLADIALDAGFADQAHMSRAFQRFFGVSPRGFLANSALLDQVFSPAFA